MGIFFFSRNQKKTLYFFLGANALTAATLLAPQLHAQSRMAKATMRVTATVVRSCAFATTPDYVRLSCAATSGLRPIVTAEEAGTPASVEPTADGVYAVLTPVEPLAAPPASGPSASRAPRELRLTVRF